MKAENIERFQQMLQPTRLRNSTVQKDETDGRTPFDSDFSRVALSAPVRRLQDKTQVFPLADFDFVRNRLTHSLEVMTMAIVITSNEWVKRLRTKSKSAKGKTCVLSCKRRTGADSATLEKSLSNGVRPSVSSFCTVEFLNRVGCNICWNLSIFSAFIYSLLFPFSGVFCYYVGCFISCYPFPLVGSAR